MYLCICLLRVGKLTLKTTLTQLVPVGKPWALCIGAGTSFPVFPSWDKLAKLRTKNKDTDFPKILAELLYHDLLNKLDKSDIKLMRSCMSSQIPSPNLDWHRFIDIIHRIGHTSADDLAQLVVDAYTNNADLKNIFTFNAESLFPTLIKIS